MIFSPEKKENSIVISTYIAVLHRSIQLSSVFLNIYFAKSVPSWLSNYDIWKDFRYGKTREVGVKAKIGATLLSIADNFADVRGSAER